uniref:Uncharacterized protein n=1 Tax=Candidatus Kentrum sp. LPFa TaxID=2126335 RepID=A0A450WS04_9GAMM|nr:MAG: hypothetical protein BECKLPF1236B_GA0070989_11878 [Candidatus Kentron sp. LPFa]
MSIWHRFIERLRHVLLRGTRVRVAAGSTFSAPEATLINTRVGIDGNTNRVVLDGDTSITDALISVEGSDNSVRIGSGGRLTGNVPDSPFF